MNNGVLLSLGNTVAIYFIINSLCKILGTGQSHINTIFSLLIAIIPIVLQLHGFFQKILGNKTNQTTLRSNVSMRTLLSVSSIFFWIVTAFLYGLLPYFSNYSFEKGKIAHSNGQFSQAIKYYEKSIHQQPERTDVYFSLANLYESIANDELSIKYYRLMIEKNSASLKSYNNLARIYLKQEKYDEALDLLTISNKLNEEKLYTEGVSYETSRAIIHKNMAWAYMELNEFSLSLEHSRIAENLFYNLGVLEDHKSIKCIISISANNLNHNYQAFNALKSCTEDSDIYQGIERSLERKARAQKIYSPSQ